MMRNNSEKNLWGMRIIAFAMALLLFVFVNYENSQRIQSTNPGDGASITGVEVLEDVPININVDRDRYYVSGIPESAEVRLRGPQSLILQTLATQNITVETPDLNQLGVGVHDIELYIEDLSNQIDYRIEPMAVTVTIEERVSETFDLSVQFNTDDVASGYEVGQPELSQTEVLVTGSASTMAEIDSVQVVVPSGEEQYTDNINTSLPVVVTDSAGELMDVSVEPSEVNVFIPIERPSKTVPLTIEEMGDTNDDYAYNVSFADGQDEEITIYGSREDLDQIETWPVEVDLSGIEEDTELEIPVGSFNGVSETNMDTVTVTVEVEENSETGNDTAQDDNSDTADTAAEEETENANTNTTTGNNAANNNTNTQRPNNTDTTEEISTNEDSEDTGSIDDTTNETDQTDRNNTSE